VCAIPSQRKPNTEEFHTLCKCGLYSELNSENPPRLVVLPNITKLNRTSPPAPDSTIEGDRQPFVSAIWEQVKNSLKTNTKVGTDSLMWDLMDEEIRASMLYKVRESFDVIPFYPTTVKLQGGEDYSSLILLKGVIKRQRLRKMVRLCSTGMRMARTWVFLAIPAVAKAASKDPHSDKSARQLSKALQAVENKIKKCHIPGMPHTYTRIK